MVDWDLAGRTARKLMSAGPSTTREEAAEVVRELHEAAAVAVAHVEKLTGMRPVADGPIPEVAVVDRPAWVDANASGMAALLDPLVDALAEKQDSRPGALATAIGSRATGVQAGGLLAFLSSRVLGQYEIFGTGGRLLLVAPNIVAAERKLGVDPADFRLWVCLHEVTHQLQFTAVPWLKPHLESEIAQFVEATDLNADVLRERLQDVLRGVVDAVRGGDGEVRGAHGPHQGPRPARRPRPGHRGDEPGGGARRVRHGRRRSGRRPDGARRCASGSPSAARAAAHSTACCAGCWAWSRR